MFKKLFKNKPIGFYFSLAASLLSLFLTIFYAAYCGAHGLFNGGVFVFYLLAFLLPLVYFFIEENDLTRIIPILQTVFLSLAVGISIPTMGTEIVYYLTGSSNIAETTASGAVLIFIIAATLVTALVSLVACFMRQTKKLTAEQQAEVDEDWANFKTNTKEFAVKHKTPLIIGGAGAVVLIVFLIILFAVIIPAALVVHVDSVKFEQESVVMYETDKLRLEPIITPEDAENKNIIYTSSDESVIKIENGVAEALKAGEATITATAEDGDASATCNVEVKELTVTETTVAKMPNTVHYMYGANEEFKSSGVSIVAKLSSGKEQKITKGKHGLTFTADEKHMKDGEIIVNDKDVTITASYTFRDKPFSATFVVHGDAAEAGSFSEFGAALSNNNIGYVYMTDDFDAGTVKVTRNLGIEGNLNASAVEVSEGATLTMEDGRIQSGGDLAISGDGAIDASAFEVASVSLQDRREHAALFAEGSLTIDGTDVVCSNVAANDFTVRGGANVTVYGKNVSIKQQAGFGDFGMLGVNGIHLAGDLTVEGEGTVLNIMYNDIAFGSSPAAVETNGVTTVDGATLNIGSSEGCASWAYTIWSGSGDDFVAKNGAKVSLSMTNDTSCFWAVNSLEVLDGSEFTMSAPNYTNADIDAKFDKDAKVTVNGTVFDMTKPLEERAFGDMTATGEVTVSVDPDMLYFAGEKFTGEGISVNAEFSGGSSSGKLRVAL
ncbi:MAG TPA: Ig-like domain-containing protein, partial [Candidatus Protoclostridium stercorigallinarum]|nr:Ig-like domain-containing protein [Candidatus Protoclostridium stercorigallinarum]